MVIRKTAALLLAASLTLTACSQNDNPAPSEGQSPVQTDSSSGSVDKDGENAAEAPGEDQVEPEVNTSDPDPTKEEPSEPMEQKPEDEESKDDKTPASTSPPDDDTAQNEPVYRYYMNKVYNIVPSDKNTDNKVVLLTFDDGPKEEEMINEMIDILDKHEAKAIFFVNGYRAKQNPELLKLIHERDQIIGNHSWDHIDLRKENEDEVKKQIQDVQNLVKDITGETPRFFRPPFGSGGDTVKQTADEHDLLFMTWSNGSLDWDASTKNKPDAVINNVLEQLHPGSNILMHELPWTVDALDQLLTQLEKKGYSFVNPEEIEPDMR
ncbi:polysaccharide deacetylase family protein [Paenibacillus lemnae]|uniref:Polysaccharide deacetylase family protein n=1 Tax=Paenibacillus lemnae TaxID=1330551 RepID=A0A848M8L1_PAELE|nr:polysaccharide deacetylase family protein [Paenibacillus lemnae]NMO96946.1 polysaccharide deacetylase family protein [Paenibacillus lemnae]